MIEEGELFDLRRPGERWLRHRGEAELEVLRRELLTASFALDVQIIYLTIGAVARRTGSN